MKSIQISKDIETNNINVFESSNKKIAAIDIMEFSKAFSWDGEEVIKYMLNVLTDCNYHTERKQIEKALNL